MISLKAQVSFFLVNLGCFIYLKLDDYEDMDTLFNHGRNMQDVNNPKLEEHELEIKLEGGDRNSKKCTWKNVVYDKSVELENLRFTCENISDINVVKLVGGGAWKNVYLGVYRNQFVFVLKTINNIQVFIKENKLM